MEQLLILLGVPILVALIGLFIEYWIIQPLRQKQTENASFISASLSSGNDSQDRGIKSRTSRRNQQKSSITGMTLAEMVKDVSSDSSKLDLICHFINDIDVPISGEEAAMILSSFLSDTDTVRALEAMSPKLGRPISDQAAKLIIKKINSSSSQAEAAQILSTRSNTFQRRRRR
jgi:hypothetical protein